MIIKKKVQQPVNEIIQKARQKGLNLPDNIEIRMIHNDVPAAYAIGMNKIYRLLIVYWKIQYF